MPHKITLSNKPVSFPLPQSFITRRVLPPVKIELIPHHLFTVKTCPNNPANDPSTAQVNQGLLYAPFSRPEQAIPLSLRSRPMVRTCHLGWGQLSPGVGGGGGGMGGTPWFFFWWRGCCHPHTCQIMTMLFAMMLTATDRSFFLKNIDRISPPLCSIHSSRKRFRASLLPSIKTSLGHSTFHLKPLFGNGGGGLFFRRKVGFKTPPNNGPRHIIR